MDAPASIANDLMRALYDRRCAGVACRHPVVVHLSDTSLVLQHEGERDARRNPFEADYTLLKEIAHLPLLVFLACDPALGPRADAELARLRELLPGIRRQLTAGGLAAAARTSPERILAAVERVTQRDGDVDLGALADELRPAIAASIEHAATLRIRGMHEQMLAWARRLGQATWAELRVVIATSPMARRESLPERYFVWLLGDEGRRPGDRRVLKAERLEQNEDALALFGMHLVDARAGELFFRDRDHLHADLLAPPLPRILAELARPFSENRR